MNGKANLLTALEDRLAALEEQIDRVVAEATQSEKSQQYRATNDPEQLRPWDLARDLQKEAQEIRHQLRLTQQSSTAN